MFSGGTIQQWIDIILYSIFVLTLFTAIYLVSVKMNNYYIQEQDKKKKLNQLKNKYRHIEKNNFKNVA